MAGGAPVRARQLPFRCRIHGGNANIDTAFAAALRRQTCRRSGGDANVTLDTAYFQNLMARRGLFHSDHELFNIGSHDALVRQYSNNAALFNGDFVTR